MVSEEFCSIKTEKTQEILMSMKDGLSMVSHKDTGEKPIKMEQFTSVNLDLGLKTDKV